MRLQRTIFPARRLAPPLTPVRLEGRPYPGATGCHFICDDGPWIGRDPAWCGEPRLQGSIYCAEHRALCWHHERRH